ncbi:Arm DNA-binding domain-containing protein [Croceicoccus naphthovorans]|uniref:Arm DNA-binding domain-containing protein n=1 Tax=Croceicoccus naphthovorans TaxID=1348774 RepID=UPI00069F381D|nr:Arm DNA-binding domain-containing protein [Croceicoccus naphthovorans]
MAKITKTFVDKVAAPAEGYEVHWDDSVKGYGLRVSAQGKRVFIVMGRVLGKSIQFTLGPYGTLTEAKARERAQKVLQDMREGIDPRAVVKAVNGRRTGTPYRRAIGTPFSGCRAVVPVVHRRDPRPALRAPQALAVPAVGGSCGPTGSTAGWGVRGEGFRVPFEEQPLRLQSDSGFSHRLA